MFVCFSAVWVSLSIHPREHERWFFEGFLTLLSHFVIIALIMRVPLSCEPNETGPLLFLQYRWLLFVNRNQRYFFHSLTNGSDRHTQILNKVVPPHLKCVAALPCEVRASAVLWKFVFVHSLSLTMRFVVCVTSLSLSLHHRLLQ